ncbi:MAG: VWA domain-containing protein [Blastocatellia bacterium]|nr:VWA domain-containing protein [Blastocatellia bacterium]
MLRSSRMRTWLVMFVLASCLPCGSMLGNVWAKSQGQQKGSEGKTPPRPELKRSPGSGEQDGGIVIKSKEVLLDVAVFDPNGKFVGDLKPEHFTVYEDQVQQKIESCRLEEAPISLGFVIDTSGSMRQKLPNVVKAALYLAHSAKKGDEFFVVDFKEKAELVEEFTSRTGDIEDALDNLIAGSGTAMLDAVAVAAQYAHKEGKNRRKALVVMSDGDERDSFYKRKDLINLMHEYDVQLYMVGFPDELSSDSSMFGKSPQKRATELIKDIAGETGGRAFFPDSLDQLAEIARQINSDLRSQYTVSYAPTNDKADGLFRRISVRVDDGKRKLVVRTRAGYTAAADDVKK